MPSNLVVSTVGASLLLNFLEPEESKTWRKRLTDASNYTSSELEGQDDLYQMLLTLHDRAQEKLPAEPVQYIRQTSAELNGIYGIYGGQIDLGRDDLHFLIATDTEQGRLCAELVQWHLRQNCGFKSVDIYRPAGLSTRNTASFSTGIKDLIGWCEESLPCYRKKGYRVIFNLTGGFKSLQGYLNTIGMFYADEMVYIFEGADGELIRIPRLPISIDVDQIQERAPGIALLAAEVAARYPAALVQHWGVPESFIDEYSDGVAISTWGKLVWNRVKHEILTDLLPFPRLEYSSNFQNEFKAASDKNRVEWSLILAKVSALLEINDGNVAPLKAHGGLQYDNYVNRRKANLEPIGHFRLNQADRVSCVALGGRLELRHIGPHDYVNGNP